MVMLQTIWPYLPCVVPPSRFAASASYTPDGDFWDFDWLAPGTERPGAPLVVLLHGSRRQLGIALRPGADGGADGARLARRGAALSRLQRRAQPAAARLPFRRPRGSAGDLDAIRARVPVDTVIYVVGISVGGSVLLNWLGRERPRCGSA
mgnify:CR=1 FL=1